MIKAKKYFIIDFDSTIVDCEGLDELAQIVLRDHPKRAQIVSSLEAITRAGMEGQISFDESLSQRVGLLTIHKSHIVQLSKLMKKKITNSVSKNKLFFHNNRDRIFVITGGFKEFVWPVLKELKIPRSHIFANTFLYNKYGYVKGFDKKNPLAKKGGKLKVAKSLNLKGEVIVVGDGFTDYEIREAGIAHKFVAFIENVKRQSVVDKADYIVSSFSQVINLI